MLASQTLRRLTDEEAIIAETSDEADLDLVRRPNVQAVAFTPQPLPDWLGELAAAVSRGALRVPRAMLDNASPDEIALWLEANVPRGTIAGEVRDALLQDVLCLVEYLRSLTAAERFVFRAGTVVPSWHCGFHLDTVPPGAPVWGLLRVYNGAGTGYVHPGNITSMREFYRFLGRRERLVRLAKEAEAQQDGTGRDQALDQIAGLDAALPFLKRREEIATVAAGAIVIFKHLDIRWHWSDHAASLAWVHCSPMSGGPRFLVNITARAAPLRRSAP